MPISGNPYLFPAPASAFRGLLDFAASQGKEFSDDEATLDLMLALDRGKVKPFRYLAKRWGWSYHKVRVAFKGDERYDTPPWIEDRVNEWRTFYGHTQQPQSDQKSNHTQSSSKRAQSKNGTNDTLEADKQSQSNQKQSQSNQYSTDTDKDTEDKRVKDSPKFSSGEVEKIYKAYPRLLGKQAALKAIRKALHKVARRDDVASPVDWLLERTTAYAKSPAGNRGTYTPYPQKWFNEGRYDDDSAEWHRTDRDNHAHEQQSGTTSNARHKFDPEKYAENQRRYGHLLGHNSG